jgi:hypothetical protein
VITWLPLRCRDPDEGDLHRRKTGVTGKAGQLGSIGYTLGHPCACIGKLCSPGVESTPPLPSRQHPGLLPPTVCPTPGRAVAFLIPAHWLGCHHIPRPLITQNCKVFAMTCLRHTADLLSELLREPPGLESMLLFVSFSRQKVGASEAPW